jgi:hypothetical protein
MSKASRINLRASAWISTSASTNTMTSPVARAAPVLRARAADSSGGPSTTITSSGASVAAWIAARHRSREAGRSVAGTTTERLDTSPTIVS